VAEAAYDYAAGRSDDDFGQTVGCTFVWVCPVCDEVVGDRGPCNGPADDEVGHASGCPRLAAAIASWRETGPTHGVRPYSSLEFAKQVPSPIRK